jgi:hypothetical protein
MDFEIIFKLWKKVLNGDKQARKEFIKIYKEHGYSHHYMDNPDTRMLHIMYHHLYKKFKK